MLKVDMLQAGHGDALLVEYGETGEERRILVDGGPWYAYGHPGGLRERLLALLAAGKPVLELLVVTHVDSDHIDGVIRLLQDPKLEALIIKDIWFNGWKHIKVKARGTLAGKHGEYLGALLETRHLPWNRHELLKGGPVVVPETGALPVLGLAGDAKITLLSPGPAELEKLRREWLKSLRRAGFAPGDVAGALEQLKHRDQHLTQTAERGREIFLPEPPRLDAKPRNNDRFHATQPGSTEFVARCRRSRQSRECRFAADGVGFATDRVGEVESAGLVTD